MFTYNIIVYERNKITYVKVDSLSYTLKLDESLDSGVLTIPRSTRRTKFDRFSRVEIKINDGVEEKATTWLVYTTKVEIDSRGANKTYNHTIGLIEPTKWLEKFVVGTLTFTQPLTGTQKTLYDYLERVRQLVPFVPRSKVFSTRLFRIDSTFRSIINSVIAPQMYLDKKNLREVLIELFKVVNAIPRLYYDSGWILTGDFINQRQLEIEIGDGDIDYIQEASGENFAQSAEIFHENTIPDKENVIYEGSITDYITFRNNDVILGESDLRLVLSQYVSEMTNLYMIIKKDDTTITKVNLNKYLYEKKVYDSLDMENYSDEKKSLAIYWTYKSNEIAGFSETFGAIFQQMAIERILIDLGEDLFWETLDFTSQQIYDLIFQVEYVPYIETMRSIQYRENFEPYALSPDLFDEYSGLIINQGERLNELFDLTENVYGQIQRLGVDTVSISKKHYLFSEVYNYGDYTTDGYIVTKVEIIPYTTYLIARYELSKNWNRIAQFIQIDKEFRPYEVSLTKSAFTLKRDILINVGFVEISNKKTYNVGTSNYSTITSIFMNTFKEGTYLSSNISVLKLRTNYSINSLAKPAASLAEKNMLKWKVDFADTKLAGKQVAIDDSSLISVLSGRRIQKGVYYTNEYGELETLRIYMQNGIYDINALDIAENSLAKIVADNLPEVNEYSYRSFMKTPLFQVPDYNVKKDSAEILGLELFLPVIPQYNVTDIFVIGDSLLKENLLIRKRTVSKTLYFYGLTSRIEKTQSNSINLSSATQLTTVDGYVNYDDIEIPISVYHSYNYFAIADSQGNLYLGVNQLALTGTKTNITKIHFNFIERKTYPEIDFETNKENHPYFYNEFELTMTTNMLLRLARPEFDNLFTLTATMFLIEIAYQYSVYFDSQFSFTAAHATGTYKWENSDVTYYNSASNKVTAYVDTTGSPKPVAKDYAELTALRLYAYNMTSSTLGEYGVAGTQIDLASATIVVSTAEDVEDVLQAGNPTAWAKFIAGNMTDTVLKVTDANLTVSYWKPTYPLHGYYKNIFVEI